MKIEISAIVPVGIRFDHTGKLAKDYFAALNETGKEFELVYVLDGERPEMRDQLADLVSEEKRVRVVQLTKSFGEAAALTAGFELTSGEVILTLPAYYQIAASEIQKLLDGLENAEVTIGVRSPRANKSKFEVTRRKVFHWLVSSVVGDSYSDLGCGARALRRQVALEIPIYGDQHRFLPLLAARSGFRVDEVAVLQSDRDCYEGTYGPRIYVRRLLDILTVVFLVRFTKKPLRFFGMLGSVLFAIGAVFLCYLVFQRLFLDIALADRPALLLSSLLVVLGLQIFALGLLGEIIIFTHAKEIKEYTVEKIVN